MCILYSWALLGAAMWTAAALLFQDSVLRTPSAGSAGEFFLSLWAYITVCGVKNPWVCDSSPFFLGLHFFWFGFFFMLSCKSREPDFDSFIDAWLPLAEPAPGYDQCGFWCGIALCWHRGMNLAGPSSHERGQAPLELVTGSSVTEQTQPWLNCCKIVLGGSAGMTVTRGRWKYFF